MAVILDVMNTGIVTVPGHLHHYALVSTQIIIAKYLMCDDLNVYLNDSSAHKINNTQLNNIAWQA